MAIKIRKSSKRIVELDPLVEDQPEPALKVLLERRRAGVLAFVEGLAIEAARRHHQRTVKE